MSSEKRVERIRTVFDDWAERGRAEGMESGHGFAARQALDGLELGPGDRYLDIGCGNGYTVRWAAGIVGPDGRAVGIDVSERMIERARSRSGPGAAFHRVAFPRHPFEPGAFDGVFSMEAFYYLPDVGAALRAVHGLLARGGRFVCVVDYYAENEESHSWPEDLDCEMTLLSEAGWREAFSRAGFQVLRQERLRYPPEEGKAPSFKQTEGSLLTLGLKNGG